MIFGNLGQIGVGLSSFVSTGRPNFRLLCSQGNQPCRRLRGLTDDPGRRAVMLGTGNTRRSVQSCAAVRRYWLAEQMFFCEPTMRRHEGNNS